VITEPVLTEDGGEGASPGDVVRVVEVEAMGTRLRMLMPWTTAGVAGSVWTRSLWGRPDSASELSEADDDEDEDELMAASGCWDEAAES